MLIVRYPNDIYDRIWEPYFIDQETQLQLSTSTFMNGSYQNDFQVPSSVMSTAVMAKNASTSLDFYWEGVDNTTEYYIYMHYAEIQKLRAHQPRNLYLVMNGWPQTPFVLPYLYTDTLYNRRPYSGETIYSFSIMKTKNSTLAPILNAYEVYIVKKFLELDTDQGDSKYINIP